MASASTWSNSISYSTGLSFEIKDGKAPERTPRELLATRAVESKDGWLGQILMSGEIVYQTEPQVDDDDADEIYGIGEIELGRHRALALVNHHVHEAFRRLIVGT